MTAQFSEVLIYKQKRHSMFSQPLQSYFDLGGADPKFQSPHSALWRGYVGVWEIVDDRLYLVNLSGTLENGVEANIETIFPGFPNRVFAHWYSETIRLPQGKLLKYFHGGYGSTFESDLLLNIEKGIVMKTSSRNNEAPEAIKR